MLVFACGSSKLFYQPRGCEFIDKTSRPCASRPASSAKLLLAGAGFLEGIMTKAQVEKRRAELLAQVRKFVKKEGQ